MIFLADTAYRELIEELSILDSLILIKDTKNLYDGVRNHPDLHLHVLNDQLFISQELKSQLRTQLKKIPFTNYRIIQRQLGNHYPDTAILNALSNQSILIGNLNTLANELQEYAVNHNMTLLHCNQGYIRCTTLPIANDIYITDDVGVWKSLRNHGFNITLVQKGHVSLPGFSYGFIGGSGGRINNTIYFNGDITLHPNYKVIHDICTDNGLEIFYIPNKKLTDIGSILYYDNKGLGRA